jgi:hypothetical protein
MAVTNTLAYYSTELIMATKRFMIPALGGVERLGTILNNRKNT